MITTTYHPVTCSCGHTGFITVRESDEPGMAHSERYTLEDLLGVSYEMRSTATWDAVFAAMRPRCPDCNAQLQPAQIGVLQCHHSPLA